jgi:hypothetical protein
MQSEREKRKGEGRKLRGIHRGYSEGQRGMQKKNRAELKFMYKYANV